MKGPRWDQCITGMVIAFGSEIMYSTKIVVHSTVVMKLYIEYIYPEEYKRREIKCKA